MSQSHSSEDASSWLSPLAEIPRLPYLPASEPVCETQRKRLFQHLHRHTLTSEIAQINDFQANVLLDFMDWSYLKCGYEELKFDNTTALCYVYDLLRCNILHCSIQQQEQRFKEEQLLSMELLQKVFRALLSIFRIWGKVDLSFSLLEIKVELLEMAMNRMKTNKFSKVEDDIGIIHDILLKKTTGQVRFDMNVHDNINEEELEPSQQPVNSSDEEGDGVYEASQMGPDVANLIQKQSNQAQSQADSHDNTQQVNESNTATIAATFDSIDNGTAENDTDTTNGLFLHSTQDLPPDSNQDLNPEKITNVQSQTSIEDILPASTQEETGLEPSQQNKPLLTSSQAIPPPIFTQRVPETVVSKQHTHESDQSTSMDEFDKSSQIFNTAPSQPLEKDHEEVQQQMQQEQPELQEKQGEKEAQEEDQMDVDQEDKENKEEEEEEEREAEDNEVLEQATQATQTTQQLLPPPTQLQLPPFTQPVSFHNTLHRNRIDVPATQSPNVKKILSLNHTHNNIADDEDEGEDEDEEEDQEVVDSSPPKHSGLSQPTQENSDKSLILVLTEQLHRLQAKTTQQDQATNSMVTQLTMKLEELKADFDSTTDIESITQLSKDIDSFKAALNTLTEFSNKTAQDLAGLVQLVPAMHMKIQMLDKNDVFKYVHSKVIASFQNTYRDLLDDVINLEDTTDAIQTTFTALFARLDESQSSNDRFNDLLKRVIIKTNKTNDRLNKLENQTKDISDSITSLQRDLKEIKDSDQTSYITGKLESLQGQMDSIGRKFINKLLDVTQSNNQLKDSSEKLFQQNKKLSEENSRLSDENKKIQNQLKTMNDTWESKFKTLEELLRQQILPPVSGRTNTTTTIARTHRAGSGLLPNLTQVPNTTTMTTNAVRTTNGKKRPSEIPDYSRLLKKIRLNAAGIIKPVDPIISASTTTTAIEGHTNDNENKGIVIKKQRDNYIDLDSDHEDQSIIIEPDADAGRATQTPSRYNDESDDSDSSYSSSSPSSSSEEWDEEQEEENEDDKDSDNEEVEEIQETTAVDTKSTQTGDRPSGITKLQKMQKLFVFDSEEESSFDE